MDTPRLLVTHQDGKTDTYELAGEIATIDSRFG